MIPKKKKGFRKIVVAEKVYYWRFSTIIEIKPEHNHSNRLEIDFGHFDPWFYANDPENKPEDFEPKSITPAFIRKSIENAIALGWNIDAANTFKKLNFRNNAFENE
ncbi:hypothetical protein [Flavobacterium pedocola]